MQYLAYTCVVCWALMFTFGGELHVGSAQISKEISVSDVQVKAPGVAQLFQKAK
jgi:hypothetical protein